MKEPSIVRTFESRLSLDDFALGILQEMAQVYSNLIHTMFAYTQAGKKTKDFKSTFLKTYEITGRQFNAINSQLEGKISSIEARIPMLIENKKERIAHLKKKIPNYEKKSPKVAHHKKRKLATLESDLEGLLKDQIEGTVRLCFGSRKLWRAQYSLEENGYKNQDEWLKDWEEARAREIFFLGSHEETQGNQSCSLFLQEDGNFKLRIRLTNGLVQKYGKYLWVHNIKISYGKKEILAALDQHNQNKGKALSFRLLKDKKGWRVFVSLSITPPPVVSKENLGVVGIDINADRLALVETDRFGNPVARKVIPFHLKWTTSDQSEAILGDVCAQAVAFAESVKKPIVLEDLDFSQKKVSMKEKGVAYSRMLSSFAYGKILYLLNSRALKKGIVTVSVNPAFTSLIGRINYAARYGMSTHESAALVIGRRALNFSEKPLSGQRIIPDGKGDKVTLVVSVRNRSEHVLSYLKKVNKEMLAALKAHMQAAKSRSRDPPKPVPVTV